MITRLIALFVLIAVVAGGTWYIFRDTPQKRILRWREEARRHFFGNPQDLERAEEFNRRILQLAPRLSYDLVFQAQIEESKGTIEGLVEALKIYSDLLSRENPRLLILEVKRAELLNALGNHSGARRSALSAIDAFPFGASMEVGRAALAVLDTEGARQSFELASAAASDGVERAEAYEMVALTYLADIAARSERPGAGTPSDDAANARQRARAALDKAITEVKSLSKEQLAVGSTDVWLANLAIRRSDVRLPGEAPSYNEAAMYLASRAENPDVPPTVHIALGALYLKALWNEREALPDRSARGISELVREAEASFARALGNSAAEAKELLALPPVDTNQDLADAKREVQQDYVTTLVSILRVLLNSPLEAEEGVPTFRALLTHEKAKSGAETDDEAPSLELAARVADARSAADPSIAGLFSLISGVARLRAGDEGGATSLLDGYVASAKEGTRSQAAIEVAEQCFRLVPSSPVVFKYLDTFRESGETRFALLTRHMRLLAAIASSDDTPSKEDLQDRIDRAGDDLDRHARSVYEHVTAAQILGRIKGPEAAVASLEKALFKYPDSALVRGLVGNFTGLEGQALERAGETERALAMYRESLRHYLTAFIQDPAQAFELGRRSAILLRALEEASSGQDLAPLVEDAFPRAEEGAVERLAGTLRLFLLGDAAGAVEALSDVPRDEGLEPFRSHLEGSIYVAFAERAARNAARAPDATGERSPTLPEAAQDARRRAEEIFSKRVEFVPNRLELLNLRLGRLGADQDVPEELVEELEELRRAEADRHQPAWLLALALRQRFVVRFHDPNVKNSELVAILNDLQAALRSVIRNQPTFVEAYVALAESLVLSAREDAALERESAEFRRELRPADHESAVQLLLAAPAVTPQVLVSLVNHSREAEKAKETVCYLEALVLAKPSSATYGELGTAYLKAHQHDALRFLAGEGAIPSDGGYPSGSPAAAIQARLRELVTGRRGADLRDLVTIARAAHGLAPTSTDTAAGEVHAIVLRELRERIQKLPEHEGMGHAFLAEILVLDKPVGMRDDDQARYTSRILDAYRLAHESYRAAGLTPPLSVKNNLAWYLAESTDPSDRAAALALAEEIRETTGGCEDVKIPEVCDTIGWVLYRNGRLEEAADIFRSVIERSDSPSARYHLACALFALRRLDEASSEVRQALKAVGDFRERDDASHLLFEIRQAWSGASSAGRNSAR